MNSCSPSGQASAALMARKNGKHTNGGGQQAASSLNCHDENNNNNNNTDNNKLELDASHPRRLIPELCRHFYKLGWASGTGGGLSIRQRGVIYCAPSGVQKERIKADDMFVLRDDEQLEILERPADERLKVSECLSLFLVAFRLRQAGCCIHSHSLSANLITALYSERSFAHGNRFVKRFNEFRIRNQEMIKGIKAGSSDKSLQYDDTLVVPIIDNVLHERDLAGAMHEAVSEYPNTNAVLVRNHGVYVWGKDWKQAKSMAECYDYLFRLKLEAIKLGFVWMLDE